MSFHAESVIRQAQKARFRSTNPIVVSLANREFVHLRYLLDDFSSGEPTRCVTQALVMAVNPQ